MIPPTFYFVQKVVKLFEFLEADNLHARFQKLESYLFLPYLAEKRNFRLDFDLNIHASRQAETHQHVNRLGIGFQNVDQPVMGADFEMLVRILVNERRTPNGEPFHFGGQRNGSNYSGAAALSRLDNPFGRLVENSMIVSLQPNAYLLLSHCLSA